MKDKNIDIALKLISNGRVDESIKYVLNLFTEHPKVYNKTYENQLVLQSLALNELEQNYRLNLIDFEQHQRSKQKITWCILEILKDDGFIQSPFNILNGFEKIKENIKLNKFYRCYFFLVDTSASTMGGDIDRVTRGLEEILNNLKSTPKNTAISIISYSSEVKVLLPLIDTAYAKIPTLYSYGGSNLGIGLKVVAKIIREKEFSQYLNEHIIPTLFIITDGYSTDNTEEYFQQIKHEKIAMNIHSIVKSNGLKFRYLEGLGTTEYFRELSASDLLRGFKKYISFDVEKNISS